MIWRADWIPARSNITGSLVSCLPGSNTMSCFPFGPLMPLWASFCRSLMCHSEMVALVSNQLVDLKIIAQQQVSLLRPVHPRQGNPGMGGCWGVLLSLFPPFCLVVALQPRLSPSAHSCWCRRATKQVLRRVPVEPSLTQPGGRALDSDLFKWSFLYHNRLRVAAALD